MFHQLHSLRPEEVAEGNVREFKGDGTSILKVPHLTGMPTRVRVGRIDLPLRVTASFPDNRLAGQRITSDMPILDVQADTDGTPVLLRSTFSNDGIWQKGETVQIWGEWEDDPSSSSNGKEDQDQSRNQDQKESQSAPQVATPPARTPRNRPVPLFNSPNSEDVERTDGEKTDGEKTDGETTDTE